MLQRWALLWVIGPSLLVACTPIRPLRAADDAGADARSREDSRWWSDAGAHLPDAGPPDRRDVFAVRAGIPFVSPSEILRLDVETGEAEVFLDAPSPTSTIAPWIAVDADHVHALLIERTGATMVALDRATGEERRRTPLPSAPVAVRSAGPRELLLVFALDAPHTRRLSTIDGSLSGPEPIVAAAIGARSQLAGDFLVSLGDPAGETVLAFDLAARRLATFGVALPLDQIVGGRDDGVVLAVARTSSGAPLMVRLDAGERRLVPLASVPSGSFREGFVSEGRLWTVRESGPGAWLESYDVTSGELLSSVRLEAGGLTMIHGA